MSGEVFSCRAPYGKGGLGRHLKEIVDEARRAGLLEAYYSTAIGAGDEGVGHVVPDGLAQALAQYTPFRFSRGWRNFIVGELFDRAVARRLSGEPAAFVGFVGKALHSFRRARVLGAERLDLHVGNSHVKHILARHAEAHRLHPGIEDSWLNATQARKAVREYALADRIFVNSEYTRQSFLEQGVPADKLRRVTLEPHPRFAPPAERPDDGVFRVVYVGSLTVAKGIPLLLEAFHRLPGEAAKLTLVGGWASRGMRRYVTGWLERDTRMRVQPGDPLPHLHRADVCVHPTWEDGFAYAPAEALACGVPVVVTHDTGMKELVTEGVDGYLLPTGDAEALFERLATLYTEKTGQPV